MGFIEAELALIGRPKLANKVVDTVRVARLKYPGQKVSLDILCSRLGVDASARDLHGALIDASLLARVFIKMMGLDRLSFAHESVDQMSPASVPRTVLTKSSLPRREPRPTVVASPEENAAFLAFIAENVKTSMWGGILGLDR
jgi:DNA polymerase-3 subunit epsilon